MKFVDEFRQQQPVQELISAIHHDMAGSQFTAQKPLQIMEVCGGHTHAIFRFGLDKLLPESIDFIHGPGCPVCVLPTGRIDSCIEIAKHPEVIFLTFGDAMRVPGSHGSFLDARREGADIRMIYSPLDALKIAQENPDRKVVFFALGFETTMPASAMLFIRAKAMQLSNLYGFCQHIVVVPTLDELLRAPDNQIDALLGPGHVSMVIGTQPYEALCQQYHRPLVVSGFEPVDMLQSVLMIVRQIKQGQAKVENQYARVVRDAGNPQAQAVIQEVFTLRERSEWRGLGEIAYSGMQFSEAFAEFDAERHFKPHNYHPQERPQARCSDVLIGRCKPQHCPLFGRECTPQAPVGALMVSSEGACAACYQYRRV
ncbi:hydrogenase formation protein HypD [Celerinatantimonas sp. YJH-8]|uniref:hydrogenase formation protein HypD n=1 Tax=Celerinatantimonas sp. YJH-8 TaxID=3228714 RepID=UPI0038C7F70E